MSAKGGLERVIFSIDNCGDLHTLAKFTRLLDTKRVMGDLVGNVVIGKGEWEGEAEIIFNTTFVDFQRHVLDSGYVDNQECFLRKSGDWRQPMFLWYRSGVTKNVADDGSVKYFAMEKDDVEEE